MIYTTDNSVPFIRVENGVHFEKCNVDLDVTGTANIGVVKISGVYFGNKKNSLQPGNAYIKQSGQKMVLENIFMRPARPNEVAVLTGQGTTFNVSAPPPATATQGFINRLQISSAGYLDSPGFVTLRKTSSWNADGKFTIAGTWMERRPSPAMGHPETSSRSRRFLPAPTIGP